MLAGISGREINRRGRTNARSLAFKAVSFLLLGTLALTGLILAGISIRKEEISDKPLHGLFPFVLFVVALCGFVSLLVAYVEFQRPVSVQLKWERTGSVNIGPNALPRFNLLLQAFDEAMGAWHESFKMLEKMIEIGLEFVETLHPVVFLVAIIVFVWIMARNI